ILSAPVSGVATRNATVAPGVAPCFRRPSAVGSTPQEHKGSGAPRTDAQRTDLTRPVPTRRTNNPLGTRTASAPAKRKPKIRKTQASFRISQVYHNTPDTNQIITILLVQASLFAPSSHFGRYFLLKEQATEYWGSTTLAT